MLGCFSDKLHVDHKNDTPQTKLSPINKVSQIKVAQSKVAQIKVGEQVSV